MNLRSDIQGRVCPHLYPRKALGGYSSENCECGNMFHHVDKRGAKDDEVKLTFGLTVDEDQAAALALDNKV